MTPLVAAHRDTTEVERVFREVYGQAVATLVRVFGDIGLAEECHTRPQTTAGYTRTTTEQLRAVSEASA